MVRPWIDMLSVFITPCTKPTRIQCAIVSAVLSATSFSHSTRPWSESEEWWGKCCLTVLSTRARRVFWSPAIACIWKLPNRMKLSATLHTIAPGSGAGLPSYITSRITSSPVVTRDSARVVGTPRWCMASLHRNSRIDERRTALPSANREYGVLPEPFSCSSSTPSPVSTSPRVIALPSPSWPAQLPN